MIMITAHTHTKTKVHHFHPFACTGGDLPRRPPNWAGADGHRVLVAWTSTSRAENQCRNSTTATRRPLERTAHQGFLARSLSVKSMLGSHTRPPPKTARHEQSPYKPRARTPICPSLRQGPTAAGVARTVFFHRPGGSIKGGGKTPPFTRV